MIMKAQLYICILIAASSNFMFVAGNESDVTSEIENLSQYNCEEMVEFYGKASEYLCLENLSLTVVGNNGIPESAFPLGWCQGDCDDDGDCEAGLICFQRDANAAVPGCSGGLEDASRTDYCISPSYVEETSVSTCDSKCVAVIDALESACLEDDGYVPPEYFLDSKFGDPVCQEIAFTKAIKRSRSCGDWTEIQSVGFDYLCSEECTDSCVTVIGNMFDQCETLPGFVEEDLVPGYNADCEDAFSVNSIARDTVKLLNYNCEEAVTFYDRASQYLCLADDTVSECEKPCVDVIDALENSCVDADGYVPPEYFLDTKFGNPACQEIVFTKAIEGSRGCGDWTEIQSVGFDDLCLEECTDNCVTVIDNMFDQCETLPSFVVEDLVPGYNADCEAAFVANSMMSEIENFENYNCQEMVEFYGRASEYLCPKPLPLTVVGNNGIPESAFPLGWCQGDCDDDGDCEAGLICFQRDADTAIPGCSGGLEDGSRTDYCIRPSDAQDDPAATCDSMCVGVIDALENSCVDADGYVPPEYFLDTKFGNPACQEIAFTKAIEGSRGCGDWTEIQSVGFDDLCLEECTDNCVTVIEKMYDQCETVPSFVVENLVPYYNSDCQRTVACLEDPATCA